MGGAEIQELFRRGRDAVNVGDTTYGLACLEKCASALGDDTEFRSYYAVCLAGERGDFAQAEALCRDAMEEEPKRSVHYLNLGRVYLAAGRKKEAIRIFRDGLLYERNPLIDRELEMLGWRKIPAIPSLDREHPINVALGRIKKKLKI